MVSKLLHLMFLFFFCLFFVVSGVQTEQLVRYCSDHLTLHLAAGNQLQH